MEDRRGGFLNQPALELTAGDGRARIAIRGAEPLAWSIAGRDLLWSRATDHWSSVAPILFPFVGWSRDGEIRVGGARYPMPVHGFAASSDFVVTRRCASAVLLELVDTAETRAGYPFSFGLQVGHALTPSSLRTEIEVRNRGATPLPFAAGLHPGFAWPFADGSPEAYRIVFEQSERAQVPEITSAGLFTPHARPVPLDGNTLQLNHQLFVREALCFLEARSRRVRFEAPCGAFLEATAEGFRHWALWSRPGAPFLCLEAWSGHGDPDGFNGDVFAKPSIDVLAPGERRSFACTWRFSASERLGFAGETCENSASEAI